MIIGYIRVSTVKQNEARQSEALKPYQYLISFMRMIFKLMELKEFIDRAEN